VSPVASDRRPDGPGGGTVTAGSFEPKGEDGAARIVVVFPFSLQPPFV